MHFGSEREGGWADLTECHHTAVCGPYGMPSSGVVLGLLKIVAKAREGSGIDDSEI